MHTECLGLVCRECGKRIPEAECALSCPDCGAPMRVMFSEASLRQALSAGLPAPEGRSFLRQWRSILPISDESLIDRVSLGEAETPLLPSHRYGEKLGIPAPTQVEYAFSTPTTWSNEAPGIPAPIGP